MPQINSELKMTRTIKADLHNHLLRTFEHFKEGDFNKVLDIASKRLGKGGIFGLVNFESYLYEPFINLRGYDRQNLGNAIYIPEKDILIVKGQEIQTKQGHLFVLGVPEGKVLKRGIGIDLEEVLKEAQDNNLITITDHPFYKEGIGCYLQQNPRLLEYFHGIETHNGEAVWLPPITPRNANQKALDFYLQIKNDYDIGAVSFSDGHTFYEACLSYTLLPTPQRENFEVLLETLGKGIKQHKDTSQDKMHLSRLGFFDHFVDLAFYFGMLKVGIKRKIPNQISEKISQLK